MRHELLKNSRPCLVHFIRQSMRFEFELASNVEKVIFDLFEFGKLLAAVVGHLEYHANVGGLIYAELEHHQLVRDLVVKPR